MDDIEKVKTFLSSILCFLHKKYIFETYITPIHLVDTQVSGISEISILTGICNYAYYSTYANCFGTPVT